MQLRIDEIVIKKRARKDLGDLSSLAESIKKYGLMSPLIVSKNRELIAGHRRLEAAKLLGWKAIPVTIVDREDKIGKLELEIEENVQRKDFSTDELAEAYLRLDKLKNPNIFIRIWQAIVNFFKRIFHRKK